MPIFYIKGLTYLYMNYICIEVGTGPIQLDNNNELKVGYSINLNYTLTLLASLYSNYILKLPSLTLFLLI